VGELQTALDVEKRILVVEDDPTMKVIIESIFSRVIRKPMLRWAYSKRGAELLLDWSEAKATPFDLVICDVNLVGDETGVDLYKQYGLKSTVPFLFLTGCKEEVLQNLFKGLKVHPPILGKKNFKPETCIEEIKTLLKLDSLDIK
jgi:DNA-binding response OmpR family regulator